MPGTTAPSLGSLARRFGAFVTERYPFALAHALEAFDAVCAPGVTPSGGPTLADLPARFVPELRRRLTRDVFPPANLDETTPGVNAETRFSQAVDELAGACEGFLERAAIRASLSPDERREMLRGMVLTRATDNRLKTLFTGGEV